MRVRPVVGARRALVLLTAGALCSTGVVTIVSVATAPVAHAAGVATLVQHPTAQTSADFPPNTDFVVPWTVAPTAGDTFLVAASNYCAVGTTTPAITSNPGGWTVVNHAFGTTEGGFMWGKLLLWRWTGAGAPGNVVMQMQGGTTSCDMSVAAFEYQGLQPNPIDVNVQTSFNGSASSWTLPTVTTTQPNELLFVAEANRAAAGPVAGVTPGFTLESSKTSSGGTTNMGLATADRTAATAAPYTPVVAFCAGCGSHPGAIVLGLEVAPVSGTPPVISGVAVTGVTASSATVTWSTDQSSTSAVAYGTTAAYGSTATGAVGSSHSVVLSGLAAGVTYHYQVSSTTTGGTSSSADATFTTPIPAPVIATGPTVSGATATAATVAWTTDRPATSRVLYGTDATYGSATTLDPANVTAHSQTLTGLVPSTTYHFAVVSTTTGGSVTSPDATFATTVPGKTDQTISFGALGGATLAQSPLTVAATATSGLPISFSSLTPAVCAAGGAQGATITLLTLGTCTLQADQPGDATFNAAPPVQQSFGVVDTSQIAYPDLIGVIPTAGLGISHPTPTTKEFDYTHIIYNAGAGPLEVLPTDYNPTTNLATGVQQLYSYASGSPVLAEQVAARDQFFFHVAHNHYHFPLATFGLYSVNADGSIGNAVAVSPKNGFCLGDDVRLDPSLAHSPVTKTYNGNTCTDPNAVRGIDSGWGDRYDKDDPGQSIDITGLPDGVYWFHSVVDPDNNFLESDKTNNTTDIKVRISGDTVTPISPLMSQGSFVFDQSLEVDGTGALSTPAFSTSAPNELLVAFTSAFSQAPPLTSTVTGAGLTWTLARRANAQAGGVDIWTAMAPSPLTNAVVTATPSWTLRDNSLTVLAIKGAAGIGATAGASGATGPPSLSLTTTKAGSWVMAVGNDPNSLAPHQIGAGKTMVHEYLEESQRSGAWVQATSAPVPAAGTAVSFADLNPPNDAWNEAAIEIVPAASADTTPPVIGAPSVAVGPTSATVTWTTDEPATSRVDFGPTAAFGQSTATDPTLVTQHRVVVTGLAPNTTYDYQVVSADAAGNTATSGPFTFVTAPPRTTPPVFSNVTVIDLEADQATISWTTDETADSRVDIGITSAYGRTTTNDPAQVVTHFVLVTNLAPATVYHYRVDGTDAFANSGASGDFTFQTLALAPAITVDQAVAKDGGGTTSTAPFATTVPGDLLVAFVGADGAAAIPQSATVSGAGLSWTLDRRANAQNGTAEVWHAFAPTPLAGATVTSTLSTAADQSLTVVAFSGARGVGVTAGASAATGPPGATLSMTGANSLVYAVGADWDHAATPVPAPGQSIVHQFLDTAAGAAYWTQALNGTGGPVESDVTMADTAPTADRSNFVAVEVQRPIGVAPPPATAPAITGANAGTPSASSATITWTTDQIATSQVLFGATSVYDNSTVSDLTPVVAHSQVLTGLTPGTQYHYAVVSTNGVGTTTSSDFTFTTAKVPQTISFAPLADVLLSQGSLTVGATASSGLTVTFSSTTTPVCTVVGTTVTLLSAGTCTIEADQAGDATYAAAAPVTQSFAVVPVKADQTITFPAPADATLAQPAVTLGATASSGLPVSYTSLTPAVCGVTGASATTLAVGVCTIQADQAGSVAFEPAPSVQQSFAVAPAPQTISFGSLANATLEQASVPVGATASSGLPVSFSSVTPAVCSVSGAIVTLSAAGLCTIEADQAGNARFAPAPAVQQTFSIAVARADQTITFPTIAGATLLQSPLSVTATASSGLAVTFSSTTPAVCTVTGASVSLSAPGTCTIEADQPGDVNYHPAPAVQQSFTVSKASQTIVFGALVDKTLAQTPVTVGATASSGLAVTFSSVTPAVCTVAGSSVSLSAPGSCTVQADQAGNATYAAATAARQSFTVLPAPAGISVDATVAKDGKGAQTTPAFGTTAPGDVLVAFVGSDGPATAQTVTVTGAGLTWSLVQRANARAGTAEVWRAIAPTTLTNVTVTSTQSSGNVDQSLTVVAFKGASGVGASASANAATGAPKVALTTTKAGAFVYAVGNDWDRAIARTVATGQTMVHQFVDTATGDTYWTQSTTTAIPAAGSVVTMSDTAPTTDRWNFAAVEIVP